MACPFLLQRHMVQLYKQNVVQYARIKLDGYTGTGNIFVTLENVLTGYQRTATVSDQTTNGRFTQVTIPMQTWYNDADLHEGFYTLKLTDGSTKTYANRLAFVRATSSASFTESTYTAYDGTDNEVYEVYEK